jgi:antitoxin (DNA-binding transcriptional repressor) of toxin-antitoxin stability system
MKTMTVGELKARFAEALEAVRQGETVVVEYGRGRRKVAALVPYTHFQRRSRRPLGLLKGKASVRFSKDFALDDETLLAS